MFDFTLYSPNKHPEIILLEKAAEILSYIIFIDKKDFHYFCHFTIPILCNLLQTNIYFLSNNFKFLYFMERY